MTKFATGEAVMKDTGDYTFRGWVAGTVWKRSGALRYIVENSDGLLFIFNEGSLKPWVNDT